MRVVWTNTALLRVEEISAHIALDHPGAAVEWVIGLFDLADSQLSAFPESGRVIPERADGQVREIIYGDYRVFYRFDKFVTILSVRHGAQLVRDDEVGD